MFTLITLFGRQMSLKYDLRMSIFFDCTCIVKGEGLQLSNSYIANGLATKTHVSTHPFEPKADRKEIHYCNRMTADENHRKTNGN